LKTFAIEAVAPPWFAPVQQQLNDMQQQLNDMQQQLNNMQQEQNGIRQQLIRIDTKASRVCPYPHLLTLS